MAGREGALRRPACQERPRRRHVYYVLAPHEVEQLKQCTGSERSTSSPMWALDAMWQAYERQGAQQHFLARSSTSASRAAQHRRHPKHAQQPRPLPVLPSPRCPDVDQLHALRRDVPRDARLVAHTRRA